MVSSRLRAFGFRALLVAVATLAAVVVAEVALYACREADRFYPYAPNTVYMHGPFDPKITLGVEGAARFTTNRFGCRGPDPRDEKRRLLVVGGSTANCLALDDSEAWPQLLMQDVDDLLGEASLWVTTSAKEGRNSRHHVMHARYLVPKIPGLDHVLYYCGVNDVAKCLYDGKAEPRFLEDPASWNATIGQAFQISDFDDPDEPWYKHLELAKVGRGLVALWREKSFEAEKQEYVIEEDYQKWMMVQRMKRRAHGTVHIEGDALRALDDAGKEYEDNLRRIVKWTREAKAEPILMAQYVDLVGLDAEEDAHLWMAEVAGGPKYAEPGQLQELVEDFNRRMRRVAVESGCAFIDLPALLQGRERLCLDGVHFNEEGARVVAAVVAKTLVEDVYR